MGQKSFAHVSQAQYQRSKVLNRTQTDTNIYWQFLNGQEKMSIFYIMFPNTYH